MAFNVSNPNLSDPANTRDDFEGYTEITNASMMQAWAAIHEDELYAAWNNAVKSIPFGKIEPLK